MLSSLRSDRRFQAFIVLLAIAAGFLAQYLYTGEVFTRFVDSNTWAWSPEFTAASIVLAAALALAVWAFFPRPDEPDWLTRHLPPGRAAWRWVIAAGACYLLSAAVYLAVGENLVVQLLWAGAIGLLVYSSRQTRAPARDMPMHALDWLLVLAATLAGFVLRYWRLTDLPSHVDSDVALMGSHALKLIQSGSYNWIGFSPSDHLLSYDQFLAWSMRLFGENHYGVVMFSVLSGTLTIPAIYFLGRELGGRSAGFFAMGLLTLSYTHIHFSRILFGAFGTLLAIIAFYLLVHGFRTQRTISFALSGIVLGIAMLIYDSGRVLPVIVLLLAGWQFTWRREVFKANRSNWILLFAGIFIGFGPMLAFALRNFELFNGRGNVVMLWTPEVWQHQMSTYNTTSGLNVIWQQTWRTFLTVFLTGDRSPHFSLERPIVSPLTAVFSVVGLGIALPRIRQLKWFLCLAWVFLTFVFGGVLTADPPYWPHLNIALPAVIVMAALGMQGIIDLLGGVTRRFGRQLVTVILVVLILVTGAFNWQAYYNHVDDNADLRIRISRYLDGLPDGYHVYMVSQDVNWDEAAYQFFNRNLSGENLPAEQLLSAPPPADRPAVFIVHNNDAVIPALESAYPHGRLRQHYSQEGDLAFTSYRYLPPGVSLPEERAPESPLALPGWRIIVGLFLAADAWLVYSRLKRGSRQTLREKHEPSGV